MSSQTTSPAVAKLLAAADEVLGWAKIAQADGKPEDALACAMFAGEYVRAARAMQEMENACRAYEEVRKENELNAK